MQDQILLKVTVVTDDDTGIYQIGELDFGIPYTTHKYLENSQNREKLADWLQWLSDQCRNSETPFHPRMNDEELRKISNILKNDNIHNRNKGKQQMIAYDRAVQDIEKATNEVEERFKRYSEERDEVYQPGEIILQVDELAKITELLKITVNVLEERLESILANEDSKEPKRGLEQRETILGNALSDKVVNLQIIGDRLNNMVGRIRL